MVRVAPEQTDMLVARPHAQPFEMRGRELAGWLHVEPAAVAEDAALRQWVAEGLGYVRGLPPKRG